MMLSFIKKSFFKQQILFYAFYYFLECHNPSKPKICKTYICSAKIFLTENKKEDLFSIVNDSKKIMFDLLSLEIQEKIKVNKRVKHILEVVEKLKKTI